MTPVREALRQLVYRIRQRSTNKLHNREYQMTLDDCVRELAALSAAPGEPCAVKPLVWRDHRPDSFPEPAWSAQTPFGFYNIEEVCASDSPAYVVRLHAHHFIADKDGLDEAKAAAQADYEQRIRSALVTTPQPPAGWDEDARRYRRLQILGCAPHGSRHLSDGDVLRFTNLDEFVDADIKLHPSRGESIRREAPAPAEGVRDHILTYIKTGEKDQLESISGEGGFRLPDDWFGSVAIAPTGAQELYAMPAATKSFLDDPTVDLKQWLIEEVSANWSVQKKPGFGRIGPVTILRDPYSAKPYVLFYVTARALPDARPDTAEARLREALEQIKSSIDTRLNNVLCEMEPGYDDSIVGFNEAWDIVRKFLREKIEALSPPSGGDEAKESEGGTDGRAAEAMGTAKAALSPTLNAQSAHVDGAGTHIADGASVSPSEPSPSADRRKFLAEEWKRQIINAGGDENVAQQAVALAALNGLFDYCAGSPADRREIVARIIDPEAWTLQGWNANWAEVKRRKQESAFVKADAILAALDGGRDA